MNQLSRQIMGLARDHLVCYCDGIWLHKEVVEPIGELCEAAAGEGIKLAIASGFRDFARQLAIWNEKATGERAVYSQDGSALLTLSSLSEEALMYAILRWSALPGTSRHHWGTDMDVWDERAVAQGYSLQLTPDEYSDSGAFSRLNRWMQSGVLEELGFFRPYSQDQGGVSPEPWHISYRPLAEVYSNGLDLGQLEKLITESDIRLKDVIVKHLSDIQRCFISVC